MYNRNTPQSQLWYTGVRISVKGKISVMKPHVLPCKKTVKKIYIPCTDGIPSKTASDGCPGTL